MGDLLQVIAIGHRSGSDLRRIRFIVRRTPKFFNGLTSQQCCRHRPFFHVVRIAGITGDNIANSIITTADLPGISPRGRWLPGRR
ncbi:hypothetical protein CPI84_09220 [Erwinia pyrifoliae]|nr:hypothetical protein CPI84_09220 [Erwinia pyrifoliae]MCA8877100.1 hypothetical protein [Erwinia pyrifoliae]